MKNTTLAIGAFLVGVMVSAFVIKYRYDETLLWGLYVKCASEIDTKLVALNELRGGSKTSAIKLLDKSLESDIAALAHCEQDLCQDNAHPEFIQALEKARAYEKKYHLK